MADLSYKSDGKSGRCDSIVLTVDWIIIMILIFSNFVFYLRVSQSYNENPGMIIDRMQMKVSKPAVYLSKWKRTPILIV